METILNYLTTIVDKRQSGKVRHNMGDIIAIVFFALLANVDDWVSIELFAQDYEDFLKQYIELPNGIPSHDTIERVFAMVAPEFLQNFRSHWDEMLNTNDGKKIQKLLAIDGKVQRGNGNKNQRANHIVSAVDQNGFCVGERLVDAKSNEITAIPKLLDELNIKGHIVTIDSMGTQTEIARKIRKKRADYVLALKGNQISLHEDVKLYFDDPALLKKCSYCKTVEKARGGIETREYWQTEDIQWLSQKKDWLGLKSIAMTRNTTVKGGKESSETRFFISSLPLEVVEIARAIRGHWIVESHHWHLDVTFREDANQTADKQAAFNLNILRKLALAVFKIYDIGRPNTSMRLKRKATGWHPIKHLTKILEL